MLLAVVGVGCGVAAYVGSVRQFDTMPVWPWASAQIKILRERLTFKRDMRTGRGTAKLVITATGIGSAEAFGVGSVFNSDESIDERMARVETRLQLLEERGGAEQARAEKAERLLEEQLAKQGRRLEEADEQLRALAKAVAVSSARLQLVGLILVGIGTMLMAVPTIVAAF
ncbi:hypothetical protein [Pseudonocardia sp.]|uniref:hypothetical protein n=1 Tax=Pseudonocardia sp. TaxID=60912 RepID=UPI002615F41D|nr:hypothetical protein [Pseudonocardia sp.]